MTTATTTGADATASAPVPLAPAGAGPVVSGARRSAPSAAWLGLVPFTAYVPVSYTHLTLPTILLV